MSMTTEAIQKIRTNIVATILCIDCARHIRDEIVEIYSLHVYVSSRRNSVAAAHARSYTARVEEEEEEQKCSRMRKQLKIERRLPFVEFLPDAANPFP